VLGITLGFLVAYFLIGVKDLLDTQTEVALENDDGLFDGDEQIGIPDQIAGGKADADLFAAFPVNDLKMMLVVRTDLKLTKAEICTQCGHGTLGAYY